MPVIGSGETDGIQTGMLEQVLVVGVGFAVLILVVAIDLGLGIGHVVGIHIADGDDTHALDVEEIGHVAHALAAATDDADEDLVIGRAALGAEQGHRGKTQRGNTGGQELAPRDCVKGGGHGACGRDTAHHARSFRKIRH